MGVIYKLKEDVVQFIISQRQSNPLASCRQLAESASEKFGLHLSKSSVHDVLKESGIITPRGRKPKTRFEIPKEKKDQIKDSLSQVKLLPSPSPIPVEPPPLIVPPEEPAIKLIPDIVETKAPLPEPPPEEAIAIPQKTEVEVSAEYEEAGKVFFKAALWDLGIFSGENINETDWNYYLTYSKGIKVDLENNSSFFVDLPVPLERCIKEVADGLINNIRPFILHKVSDEGAFNVCMDAQSGFNIKNIAIVDEKDHILLEFSNIIECKRTFTMINRIFVESSESNLIIRSKEMFFSQTIDNSVFINNIMNLKGFDTVNKDERVVTLIIDNGYENKTMLQAAAEKLNEMYLRDEQDRLVKVNIQEG